MNLEGINLKWNQTFWGGGGGGDVVMDLEGRNLKGNQTLCLKSIVVEKGKYSECGRDKP